MPFKAGFYYSLHEGGKANQKPVILIHGAGSSHLMWPVEIRRLPGHTVIALDLPGHGRSTGVGYQSIGDYTAAVVEFLADQGIYQAAFIGHSLGGAIALQLALDFPQHVIGIGILSAGANFNPPAELLAYLSNPATSPIGIQRLQELMTGTSMPPPGLNPNVKAMTNARPSVIYNDWLACSRFDLCKQAGQINTPAYVACGDRDRLTPPAGSKYLAELLPLARLDLIQGAGYLLPLEQPQSSAAGLKHFLDDLLAWHARFPLPAEFPQTVEKNSPEKRIRRL